MAELKVSTDDFALTSSWKCGQSGGSWQITSGPTTVTKVVTFPYSLPSGSIINKATIHATCGSPLSGADILTANDGSLKDGAAADVTSYVSASATSVEVTFKLKVYGSVYQDTNTHYGSVTFSDVYLLIDYTIPASAWSLSATSVEAGGTVKVTITPADTSFSHKVQLKFGDVSVAYTLSAGQTSASLSILIDWLKQIPNAASGVATLYLQTISNGTVLNTSAGKSLTITTPASAAPAAGSLSFAATNQSWSMYIQGRSSATVTLSGHSAQYGATIKSVTLSGNGVTSSTTSLSSGVFRTAGTVTFTATVVDSRGKSSTTSASITVQAYQAPSITAATLSRANSSGTLDAQGTTALMTVSYTYTKIGQNAVTVSYVKYRVSGASSWTTAASNFSLSSGGSWHLSGLSLDTSKSYEFEICVSDSLNSTTVTRALGTGYSFAYWDATNNAIGFGCRPSGNSRLQLSSDWKLYLGEKIVFDYFHPVGSVCFVVSGTSFEYGTWKQIGTLTIGSTTVNAWQRTA